MDVLVVTSNGEFNTLVRVAEAMSYKYRTFTVSAHGRQIQRSAEVLAVLSKRRSLTARAHFGEREGDSGPYPTIEWTVQGI